MSGFHAFPDKAIGAAGPVSQRFLSLGINSFHAACRFAHELPYGYNSDRDDLMILFEEKLGSCTTKHAVIATLARELGLPIEKHVGIYAMTEEIVTGTAKILAEHDLPYVPMLHCFLVYGDHRVDLTEGNRNGKNRPIDEFLHVERVEPNIPARDEYLLYRKALERSILEREELKGASISRVLKARELGLQLLRKNLEPPGGGGSS
jgi:hypothetical protein